MKYRMSEGLTNIGTPLKEAMERSPRPAVDAEQQFIDAWNEGKVRRVSDGAKPWVGLTLADKEEYLALDFGGNRLDAMDWVARRLKEKNT
jgi:hypothetical protein